MRGTYFEKLWQVLGTIDQTPDPHSCGKRSGQGDGVISREDLLYYDNQYIEEDLTDKKYFESVFTCSPLFSARPALLELDTLLGNGDKKLSKAEINAILGIRIKEKPIEQITEILLRLRRRDLVSFFRYIDSLDEKSSAMIYETMREDPRYLNTVLNECYDLSRGLLPETAYDLKPPLIYLLSTAMGLLHYTYKGKGEKGEAIYQRLKPIIKGAYDLSISLLLDNADKIRDKLIYLLQGSYHPNFQQRY